MKKITLFLFATVLTITAMAQSVQEGINHLYAERNVSAKGVFDKLLATNPNNIDAIYWLGQTHIAMDDLAGAKAVYQKALATNGNIPLVIVGMGHIDLLEGRTSEARQRFETALTASRGKKGDDPTILNAVGRANVESRTGDIAYAISKLNAAAQLAPSNPDIYINLGNAYRKAKDGGQAISSYMRALNSNAALANYRMARVYETQRNWDIVTEFLNKAIAADPKFAPAYLRQYVYALFHKNDYSAADEWAKKYIASSDPSVQNEYFRAQALYQQKNFQEALNIGKRILDDKSIKPGASVYRLMAYSNLALGDTLAAKTYVDQLFSNAPKDEFVTKDYTLKATIYSKVSPQDVVDIYMDAASEDTTLKNKVAILQEALTWARENNKKIPEGDIRLALFKLMPNPNPASLFNIGLAYYQGGAFKRADSAFQGYSAAFPDSTFGYLWSARALSRIDSTGAQGLAIPQYEKLLEIAAKDPVRHKSLGMEASVNLADYYVNVKKDKEKGIFYLTRGLEFDPANETFKSNIEILKRPPAVRQTPSKPVAKPKAATKTAPKKKS
jgi:tetratricopeptide (TPR) repeat protein